MDKYKKYVENSMKELVLMLDADGDYGLVIPTSIRWAAPLPRELAEKDLILVSIAGWTREVSFADDNGVFVRTAFGESENQVTIPYWMIAGVFDKNNAPLFTRVFYGEDPSDTTHTLASVLKVPKDMLANATKGESASLLAMKRNNPGMFDDK